MKLVIKSFEDLTKDELYEILRVRSQVFVIEQECFYQDMDGLDQLSVHVFYEDEDGKIQAYLRYYNKEDEADTIQVGRVLTIERGTGLGAKLIDETMQHLRTMKTVHKVHLDALEYATGYYEREGFKVISEEFYNDGQAHVEMEILF